MTLKDNLKALKNGLNAEGQFIENFIKGERFIRKYKFYIFTVLAILIIGFLISYINSQINEYKVKESNEIYTNLLQNPEDKNLLKKLKDKNINLYAIFLIKENFSDQNNTIIQSELKEIGNSEKINILLKNIIALSSEEKSIFLKNYNKLMQAYRLLDENKIEEANILLSQIQDNSSLAQIAQNLKHYQGISE